MQHFAVLLKYIIHVAIPDVPTWVKEEMAKLDYQRREAFKVRDDAKGDNVIANRKTRIYFTKPHLFVAALAFVS